MKQLSSLLFSIPLPFRWLLAGLFMCALITPAYPQQYSPVGITRGGGNGSGVGVRQLQYPAGCFVDGSGTIYVADEYNHRIQKFPPNSTSLTNGTTVAGAGNGSSGNAANQLAYPTGVFVDAQGFLFVADRLNNRIQKFPPNSTSLTNGNTVAGTGVTATNRLSGPYDVFVDKAGFIFVADSENDRVLKFPPTSTAGTNGTIVVGQSGLVTFPRGVFIDSGRNIFITDRDADRVKKFPPASTSLTSGTIVAGTSTSGSAPNQLNSPRDVYVNEIDYIFIADADNNRIQKFPPNSTQGTIATTITGTGQLVEPRSLFVDPTGNMVVVDAGNNRIQMFRLLSMGLAAKASAATVCAGSSVTLSAGVAGGLAPHSYSWTAPPGITFDPADGQGSLVVTSLNTTGVKTFTVTVADATTFVSTSLVSVTVSAAPSLTVTANPGFTINATDSVTLTASGAASYTWTGGTSGNRLTATPASTNVYSVTGRFPTGCSSVTSVTVTVNDPVITDFAPALSAVCSGSIATFSATVNNITGPYNYTLTNGAETLPDSPLTGTATGGAFSQTLTASGSGIQTFTLTVSKSGLSVSATAALTVNALSVPVLPSNQSAVCTGGSVVVVATVNPADSPTGFQWYKDGQAVSGQHSATLSLSGLSVANSGSYSLVLTGSCNSVTSAAFTLTVNATPSVAISPSAITIGQGASATLTASGAASYSWSTGASSATISVSPPQTTTYSVVGTTNGCSSMATAVVSLCTRLAAQAISVTIPGVLGPGNCVLRITGEGQGNSFVVTGSGGYVYSNAYRAGGRYTMYAQDIKQPGTYTFTAYYRNECGEERSDSRTFVVSGTACQ